MVLGSAIRKFVEYCAIYSWGFRRPAPENATTFVSWSAYGIFAFLKTKMNKMIIERKNDEKHRRQATTKTEIFRFKSIRPRHVELENWKWWVHAEEVASWKIEHDRIISCVFIFSITFSSMELKILCVACICLYRFQGKLEFSSCVYMHLGEGLWWTL